MKGITDGKCAVEHVVFLISVL